MKKLSFVYATDNYSKPSDYRMGIELLAVRLNDQMREGRIVFGNGGDKAEIGDRWGNKWLIREKLNA